MRFYIPAPADRVFALLIGVLNQRGRVHGIEGRGTVVVFETQRSPADMSPRLRASVTEHLAGTVIQTDPADLAQLRVTDEEQDLTRLLDLLTEVCTRAGCTGTDAPCGVDVLGPEPASG